MSNCDFSDDDVVISGMAIHLPAIDSLEKFSSILFEGMPLRPKIKEVVPDGYHGEFPEPAGRITGLGELDTIFFGMNTATFLGSDRSQMKALETCYEALMDSGINTKDIQDYMTEIHLSLCRTDGEYVDLTVNNLSRYSVLGHSRAIAPNRVSFFLDFKGPSIVVDNGNCGGMQSLVLGWRDIKEGRCDMAVVSSGNVLVGENITAAMSDFGWICQSGKTRAFDNAADGFQRIEGYASLILQRAKHAKRIYAKVKHACCETVPKPMTTTTKPSKECWINFLDKFYAESGIDKNKIAYLETYGTAIKDWDAAELNAVTEALVNNRKTPLMVGSVKSNIGNAEGAADLLSIIKAIICLENGKVPANKHYNTPNSSIPGLFDGRLKVIDKNLALPENSLIAINSYSFGNVYSHCILEGFKKPKVTDPEKIPRLVLLSARTDEVFPKILHQVEEEIPFDTDYINLMHEIFKHGVGQHLARGYTILPKQEKSLSHYQTFAGEERPLWLVFSGMGSQWPGMGRDLMKLPLARNSIQECHDILKKTAGLDLINILTSDDPNMFIDNLNSFVGIGAIQIALVDILKVLNVVPDGIIGHSLGELGCAYIDGSLTLEQTILAAYYRGKAVKEASLQRGAMAAVGRGYNQLKDELPENVELACHNSSTSCTISGLEAPVLKYVDELQKRSIFAKVVEVGNIGFHSQFIAPAGPYLLKYMKNVIKTPKLRSSKWISSSVPESGWKEEAAMYSSPEYFTNNLLRFVLFEESCAHIPENAILIEIAPHGLLQAILKRSFPNGINIPITNRGAPDNLIFLLQAIGKLYVNGITADVAALYTKPDFPVPTKTPSLHRLFPYVPILKPTIPTPCNAKRELDLRRLVRKCDKTMGEYDLRGQKVAPTSMYPVRDSTVEFARDQQDLKIPALIYPSPISAIMVPITSQNPKYKIQDAMFYPDMVELFEQRPNPPAGPHLDLNLNLRRLDAKKVAKKGTGIGKRAQLLVGMGKRTYWEMSQQSQSELSYSMGAGYTSESGGSTSARSLTGPGYVECDPEDLLNIPKYTPEEELEKEKDEEQGDEENIGEENKEKIKRKNIPKNTPETELEEEKDEEKGEEEKVGGENEEKRKKHKQNKLHYCSICKELKTRITRHRQKKHKDHPLFRNWMALPKDEMAKKFRDLIKEEDFMYNSMQNDHVIVTRKVATVPETGLYTTCYYCGGAYLKSRISQHLRRSCKCQEMHRKSSDRFLKAAQLGKKIEQKPHPLSGDMEAICCKINPDLYSIIVTDETIVAVGHRLVNKYGLRYQVYIRGRLRRLGNILKAFRLHVQRPTATMEEAIVLDNYSALKEIAIKLSDNFNHPSVILRTGEDLLLVRKVLENKALVERNKQMIEETSNFLKLFEGDWRDTQNFRSHMAIDDQKAKKRVVLPLSEDIAKLKILLENKINTLIENIKPGFKKHWQELARCVLVRAIIFNRRRAGETGKMLMDDFLRDVKRTDENVSDLIEADELEALSNLKVIVHKGKKARGKRVTTILPPLLVKAIHKLNELRLSCGVIPQNQYLFAKERTENFIEGSEAVRTIVNKFSEHLKKPMSIRGTLLRKQLATTVHGMNLDENDKLTITDHLSHNVDVHNEKYLTRTVAGSVKMSRLLLAADQGTSLRGKTFRDLPLAQSETGSKSSSSRVDSESYEAPDAEKSKRMPRSTSKRKTAYHHVQNLSESEPEEFRGDGSSDEYIPEGDLTVAGMVLPKSHLIEIAKNDTVLASACVSRLEESLRTLKSTLNSTSTIISLTKDEFYYILAERGYFIPKGLRHVIAIDVSAHDIRGTIARTNEWVKKLEAMLHMVYFNVSRQDDRIIAIKKIGAIDVAMINLDKEANDDLEVLYDIETNELACAGLYVKDITYEAHDNSSMLTVESTLAYSRPPLKTIHKYIEYCGQIISNLNGVETLKDIKVLDLQQDKFPELSRILDSIFPNVKVGRIPLSSTRKYDLVICAQNELELHSRLMEEYALVTGYKNQDFGNFAVVSSFETGKGEELTLLKKKVVVNGDYLIIRITEQDDDLIDILKQQPERLNKKVLIMGKSEPNDGILNFVRRIQSQTALELRWMFILDDSAEEFNTSNPFYKQQLEKDLCLNVLLNGAWNFVYKKKVFTNEVNPIQGETTTCGSDVSWPMPASWQVDNKDEIADAYAMAYLCIISKANTKSYDSVLITDGSSVIGQAALAVALTKTNRVYVTVESEDEKTQLSAIFPQINPDNIFLHSDLNFVIKLRESLRNDFPNIVFNTLDGRVAHDLIAFPSPYSKIFHLGKDEIKNNHIVPTSQFLRYVSLIAMDMNNIRNWHIEDKLEVRRLIENGLKNGVIKPLKAIDVNPIASHIRRNQNLDRLGAKLRREHSFKVTSTGSYLVSGDGTGVDLDIAHWLIRRGAKNIFILNISQSRDSTYTKKLNLLSLHKNATVQTVNETAIKEFLREVARQSIRLDAAFYINLKNQDASPLINKISEALSTEMGQMIAISQNRQFALKMQKYAHSKNPCTSIVWNQSKELLITNLDVISNFIGGHTYLSVVDEAFSSSSYTGAGSYCDLIPSNLESLHMLISGLKKEVKLVELANAGHLMENCVPECQPVFLIPGVENEAVELTKSLARGLLYPAFVATIPKTEKLSIASIATAIVSEIIGIADRKVYNLVGLSSGCVLALEVARQLEKMRKVASILLVDNPLNILQQSFVTESTVLEIFETMAESGDKKLGLKPLGENWIFAGAKYFNDYFAAICNYDAADLKLNGPLTVMRSSTFKDDNTAYNDVCIDSYIVDSPLNHKSLLCSKELQDIVNKTVVLDDVPSKTIHEPLWVTFENVLENYRVLGKLGLEEKYVTY